MNTAIVVAGGTGSRLSKDLPKQLIKINSKTILEHTVEKFYNHSDINTIIIVIHNNFEEDLKKIVCKNKWQEQVKIVLGGNTRQKSVFNALEFLNKNYKNLKKVLIHDAARPLVSTKDISKLISKLDTKNAISLATPSTDTIIRVKENKIIDIPPRKEYWQIQTPQCFDFKTIHKAHSLAKSENFNLATDDTSLVLKYNLSKIYILEGSKNNIKITYPEDIEFAKHIFQIKRMLWFNKYLSINF